MASPFETVILNLRDVGAFQFFFPFLLTSALFYGLLRRSQVFGKPTENVAVNGVVSLVAAFMVWAYPILTGVNVETQLATFFFNGTIAMLTIVIGLLISSMVFPEGLGKTLENKWKGGAVGVFLVIGMLVALGIFLSSGLIGVFIPGGIIGDITDETILTVAVLAAMLISVLVIIRAAK